MTNKDKAFLARAIKEYFNTTGGECFSFNDVNEYVWNYTMIRWSKCTVRNYLKAFGGINKNGKWVAK